MVGAARMSPDQFKRSVAAATPPDGLSPALAALWWAAKPDWQRAHRLVMDGSGADCAWVHAYLHRQEGDLDNARYWYRQARKQPAQGDLGAEWAAIAAALL